MTTQIQKTTQQVKATAFTEAMTAELVRRYTEVRDGAESVRREAVKQLAVDFFGDAKATRRIIGKLGTLKDDAGLPLYRPYEAKVASTKRGPTRAELRRSLEALLLMPKNSLVSFDRSNSGELQALFDTVKEMAKGEPESLPDASES